MAEVFCSACAPPTASECVLPLLMRVYIVEEEASSLITATGSNLGETFSAVEGALIKKWPDSGEGSGGGTTQFDYDTRVDTLIR